MLSYVTLGSRDLARARRFYDPVIATLDATLMVDEPTEIAYGPKGVAPSSLACFLFLLKPFNGLPATWGNGVDVAFVAASPAAVDAFYAAALAHGGADEGPPGPRPNYGVECYTAYVRDPDGNTINAWWAAERAPAGPNGGNGR
jgi:catechol 2,3-dioxygenase-like lactoylglutathione lyase family enzyme